MASSARIDELRKKFDENPRRYFAPLANEYRKAGDLDQAIFICQEYLPQQPGHMSGHIVYGQTLFDLGRDEEAKAVFETALTLDPENLIALKHLGDIARQAGDLDGARGWYQRVLEADPRNDEIMQILESLGGTEFGGPLEVAPPRAVESTAADYFASASPSGDAAIDVFAEAESTANFDARATDFEIPPLPVETTPDVPLRLSTPPRSVESAQSEFPESLHVEQAVDAEMPDSGSATTELAEASAESEPPATSHDDELLDLADFSFETAETPAAGQTATEPLAIHDEFSAGASAPDAELPQLAPEETPHEPVVELATDLIIGLPDDSPAPRDEPPAGLESEPASPVGHDLSRAIDQLEGLETFSMDTPVEMPPTAHEESAPASDTFATETMAELYAQQGHLESAMEIYDQLISRTPDDAELRRRASEVANQMAGADGAAEDPAFTASSDETIAQQPTVAAGPTIREFFREILDRHRTTAVEVDLAAPIGEPADDASVSSELDGSLDVLFSDAPTADADHAAAMSLAQAFGGETPDGEESPAMHGTPAHPATDELSLDHVFRTSTPAKGTNAAGGFSLDQFFSGELTGADASEGSNEAAPPRSSDDIAQFNAWLNGLKKT